MLDIPSLKKAILGVYSTPSVEAQLCFLQAVHESGLLQHPSKLASQYNNLFGIKGKGLTNKSVLLPTWEMQNGKVIRVKAEFAFNDSIDDSIKQYKALIARPRYQKVREAKTLDNAIQAVYDAGYCTDNRYVEKLHGIQKETGGLLA